MNVFMVYTLYWSMFLFLNYTRFGFELVNQKMFKMKFFKMTQFTYLVIFDLKLIVCQNVNSPHTYGDHPQKHPFVI
jgi:hypothetical protein